MYEIMLGLRSPGCRAAQEWQQAWMQMPGPRADCRLMTPRVCCGKDIYIYIDTYRYI